MQHKNIDSYTTEDMLLEKQYEYSFDYDDSKILLWHLLTGVVKDLSSPNLKLVLGAHNFLSNVDDRLNMSCTLFGVDYNNVLNWYNELDKDNIEIVTEGLDKLYKEIAQHGPTIEYQKIESGLGN